jgi:cation:H+ antiporter
VVALGPSLPELVVSLRAALGGATGLAVGNIVGSNIANILLILGTAALITPVSCTQPTLMRDALVMLAATVVFVAVGFTGGYDVLYGGAAVIALIGYLGYCYDHDRRNGGDSVHAQEADEVEPIQGPVWKAIAVVVGGLVGVLMGGELLVNGAVDIARALGVSDEVIGLTLVAFGTSVPELATTVVAAMRRHADVALGNVLGSNLFNLLGILGVTSIVVPLPAGEKILAFDVWVLLAVTVLLIPFMRTGWRIGRGEGAVFVAVYVAFIAAQFFGVGEHMAAMAAAW